MPVCSARSQCPPQLAEATRTRDYRTRIGPKDQRHLEYAILLGRHDSLHLASEDRGFENLEVSIRQRRISVNGVWLTAGCVDNWTMPRS